MIDPAGLIAGKVLSVVSRQGKPKAFTDSRDIAVLLLRFPELKMHEGSVRDRLVAMSVSDAVLKEWDSWVDQELEPEGDDDF